MDIATVQALEILFSTPIRRYELPLFRGAVIKALPHDSVLFHNHVGNGLRYGYPLIQYKIIDGKASLFCIGKGTESVWDFFAGNDFDMRLGSRKVAATVEAINDISAEIAVDNESPHKYSIHDWLPFNQENYNQFNATESLAEKISMLNHILAGNILTMLKGVNVILKERLNADISSISESKTIKYKNIRLLSLDATFFCNVVLPQHIGLGKHASLGYGTVENLE
jgi:hypothetical protein